MHRPWKIFFALTTLVAIASLASVPLEIAALAQVQSYIPWWASVIAFAFGFVPSVVGIAIGVATLPATGLRLPVIKGLIEGQPINGATIRTILARSVLVAIAGFVSVHLFSLWVGPFLAPAIEEAGRNQNADAVPFSSLQLLLLSFAAGAREGIVFRFGLMTLIIWIGTKLFTIPSENRMLIWTANLSAAIPFALVHSINAFGLGIPITLGLIAVMLLSNGSLGILFGWLYARFGLVAAMTAHTAYDIITVCDLAQDL